MPFYLIDQHGTPVCASTFDTEDKAYEWVEENLGADAWNDSAILAAYDETVCQSDWIPGTCDNPANMVLGSVPCCDVCYHEADDDDIATARGE